MSSKNVTMSSSNESKRIIDNNNSFESTCVVCFKQDNLYYSIGECDHPVCYECSTRMRVLCRQNECPICRQDLSKVIRQKRNTHIYDFTLKSRKIKYWGT